MKQLKNKLFILMMPILLWSESAIGYRTAHKRPIRTKDTVIYNLTIDYKTVNFTGKNKKAMVINDSLPAPTLHFKEGENAIIFVTNKMDVETSIHWHGILLPNFQDGVPYLTSPPILPGKTHKFEFKLKQSGTYWYHSHTKLQEQRGIYGAIVIEPKKKVHKYNHELVLVLSDWTDEKPQEVLRTLKRGSEWYAIKKGTALSLFKVIKEKGLRAQLKMWQQKMPGMDISDVYYDAFLINGKKSQNYPYFKAGEKIRLRVINAAASSYFWLTVGGEKPLLISADGIDVKPVATNKILHAIGETYDFLVKVPEKKSIEIRATAQDVSGSASTVIGTGELLKAPVIPKLNPIEEMKKMAEMHGSHGEHKGHSTHDKDSGHKEHGGHDEHNEHEGHNQHNKKHKESKNLERTPQSKNTDNKHNKSQSHTSHEGHHPHKEHSKHKDHPSHINRPSRVGGNPPYINTLNYNNLRATQKTSFAKTNTIKELYFNLTGNMWRYVWSLNGKTLSQSDKIKIKKGETVRIHLHNTTMMHHPMHLHGHFFRVLNKQGEHSPLKHTVNIPPMKTVTIEFDPDEKGDWMFHCHILYHMKSGMSRVFSYGDKRDPRLTRYPISKAFSGDTSWYKWGELDIMSNRWNWELVTTNTKNKVMLDGTFSWVDDYYKFHKKLETELSYEYFVSDFFRVYAGAGILFPRETDRIAEFDLILIEVSTETFAKIGFRYLLPYFLELDVNVDYLARLQIALEYEFLLFSRVEFFAEWEWTINFGILFPLLPGDSWEQEHEWEVGFNYILNKNFSLTASYSNHFSWGAGLNLKF